VAIPVLVAIAASPESAKQPVAIVGTADQALADIVVLKEIKAIMD
jgi:hypothetical protein